MRGQGTSGLGLIGEELTRRILRCAFAVHRELGPGLLESAYRACLARELAIADIPSEHEVLVPIVYKGVPIDCGYRANIIVRNEVLLELKAVERLLPIHEAQLLTYLKLCKLHVGLLLNFNTIHLRNGMRRLVL